MATMLGRTCGYINFIAGPKNKEKGKTKRGQHVQILLLLAHPSPISFPSSCVANCIFFSLPSLRFSHLAFLSNPLIAKKIGIIASNFSFMAASLSRSKCACHCESVAGVSSTYSHTHRDTPTPTPSHSLKDSCVAIILERATVRGKSINNFSLELEQQRNLIRGAYCGVSCHMRHATCGRRLHAACCTLA